MGVDLSTPGVFIVLVCGGREYCDFAAVCRTLDRLRASTDRPLLIVHGAARGADSMASAWVKRLGDERTDDMPFPADWTKHRRAAGPIRNRQMLRETSPHLVLAFPGRNGTEDMCSIAEAAGMPVRRVG